MSTPTHCPAPTCSGVVFELSDVAPVPVLGGDEDDHTGEDGEGGAKEHKKTEGKPGKSLNEGKT